MCVIKFINYICYSANKNTATKVSPLFVITVQEPTHFSSELISFPSPSLT